MARPPESTDQLFDFLKPWLSNQEIEILKHCRWFVTIAAVATFLHGVASLTDSAILRGVAIFLIVCDAIGFCVTIFVLLILQLRRVALLLNVDIFEIAKGLFRRKRG